MFVPRFLRFDGYKTVDHQASIKDNKVYVKLEPESGGPYECYRCLMPLEGVVSSHRLTLKDMALRGFETVLHLRRRKGRCPKCKKIRNERIPFLAKESPHFTQDYAWWVGKMCEFAPVSRVAEMMGDKAMTVRRIDLKRMQRMLQSYKIPPVTHIAVDEVYARRHRKDRAGEDRDDCFFTVITDLKTRKVVWVAESRKRKALDQFFALLGKNQCELIKVVAIDQHDGYKASIEEHCPNAVVVWDKFHILQKFEEAVNEVRKRLHSWLPSKDPTIPLTRPKHRFIFLKRASSRTKGERDHIEEVLSVNKDFAALELIKERMLSFFDAVNENDAWDTLMQIGQWISEKKSGESDLVRLAFEPLANWHTNIVKGWKTLKNYFRFPVTSALAEGINNVIKALKRRAYGYRDMDYFRLKIMQVCGYLNSRFIKFPEALGT
jgi:transposase